MTRRRAPWARKDRPKRALALTARRYLDFGQMDSERLQASQRAHDTADAYRRAEGALRAHADTARKVAQAFTDIAEAERREADADPDPHHAQTRRYQAGLNDQHAEALRKEIETTLREAETEGTHADAAEARAVAARGSSAFEP